MNFKNTSEIPALISGKKTSEQGIIIGKKRNYIISVKEVIFQKDIKILNRHATNNRALRFII